MNKRMTIAEAEEALAKGAMGNIEFSLLCSDKKAPPKHPKRLIPYKDFLENRLKFLRAVLYNTLDKPLISQTQIRIEECELMLAKLEQFRIERANRKK